MINTGSLPHGVGEHHKNTLYLLSALCMIFMTLVIAMQPLYLRSALGVTLANAGAINATIQVVSEIADLLLIGYFGYLSDRFGRIPLIVFGFILAGCSALIAPFSLEVALPIGLSGLVVYFLMRVLMSIGTCAVWPQLIALSGDFSVKATRARLLANTAFIMAFGATLVYTVLMQIPQHSGWRITMLLNAVIAFIGAGLARVFLVDVSTRLIEKKIPWARIVDLVRNDKRLRLSFLSAFSGRNDLILIGLFLMLWHVYFADVLNISHDEAAAHGGLLIGYIGFVIMIAIPFWGMFLTRWGRVTAIAVGMGLTGTGLLSFAAVVNPFSWEIMIPATLIGLGQAGTLLAPQVLALDLAPQEIRGSVLGAFNTVGTLGIIFFVQIGGMLFDWIGPYGPFVFTGIANILIMMYALAILKTK